MNKVLNKFTPALSLWFFEKSGYNRGGISEIQKKRYSEMTNSVRLQIRSKGTMTLPVELRRKYGIDEGDVVSIIDLGDGALLLTPIITKVDRLGDRIAKAMEEAGVSEDELLAALDEERERYYQERYVED